MCPLKFPFLGPTLGAVFQWVSLGWIVLGGGALSRFGRRRAERAAKAAGERTA